MARRRLRHGLRSAVTVSIRLTTVPHKQSLCSITQHQPDDRPGCMQSEVAGSVGIRYARAGTVGPASQSVCDGTRRISLLACQRHGGRREPAMEASKVIQHSICSRPLDGSVSRRTVHRSLIRIVI